MLKRLLLITCVIAGGGMFYLSTLSAQDFMLQGWYWDYPKTADGANWADHLKNKTQELSDAGFTYVWLPPLSRAASGPYSNGYDPKDLFDLGEYGQGATGFGTRNDVDALIASLEQAGIDAVADVVYNHRDGGSPENNPAVAGWIRNLDYNKVQNGDQPYPSDRFRLILPLGGSSGLGSGTYYFKFGSRSGHPNFHNKPYKVYMQTNTKGYQGQPHLWEFEPNGGGGCGQPNNTIELGRDMFAHIDAFGCTIDEFALTIHPGDYDPNGDVLYIYVNNRDVNGLGDYSDHTVLELYYSGGGGNIENRLIYQTYTDFTNLPSGQGAMNWTNFKPNGQSTQLAGDWDAMYFFYDYDQNMSTTQDVLFDWTRWLWQDVRIRGFRMDAVKHFPPYFVGDLLDYLHDNNIEPGMVVGEFFDGNTGALKYWIDQVYSNMDADTKDAITPRVFDFSLRYALKASVDNFGYDVRNVFNASMVDAQQMSGFNVVTFTDNHDFRDPGSFVVNDPMLGYAYILTNNQVGLPCVYYTDYYDRGLKSQIDQLIDIHREFIFGASERDYLSRFGTPYMQQFDPAAGYGGYTTTTLLYQLHGGIGGRDVIVAINYAGETLDVVHGVNTTSMGVSAGDALYELTGNAGHTVVQADGTAHFVVPPRSYAVYIANKAPTADAGSDAVYACTGDTGTVVSLDGSDSDDPEGDALTYSWSGPFGTVSGVQPVVSLPTGIHTLTLTVDDGYNGIHTDEVTITVEDTQGPVLSNVIGPIDPQPVGTSVSISADYSDACGSPHSVSINWGDGSIHTATVQSGQISADHTYTQAGVYIVSIDLSDADGNTGQAEYRYVVVYDAAAGFVTGGGWIDSPAGAYIADPSLTGKANFGFVAKYKKGQSRPDGNTSFKFKAGDLDFRSTFYDWLVISGPDAKFKGEGTINGGGHYGFMLTARDGALVGNDPTDRFHIKIWDIHGENVIYDNQPDSGPVDEATDAVEGGSIVIHKDKSSNSLSAAIVIQEDAQQLQAFPNPSSGQVEVRFVQETADVVDLEVWNVNGQRLRVLHSGPLDAGSYSFDWDGRSETGQSQSSGVYFLRYSSALKRQMLRLVLK